MSDRMRYVCSAWGCFELTRFYDGFCAKHEAERASKDLLRKFKQAARVGTEKPVEENRMRQIGEEE